MMSDDGDQYFCPRCHTIVNGPSTSQPGQITCGECGHEFDNSVDNRYDWVLWTIDQPETEAQT